MRGKLIGFALALLSVAAVGITQLDTAAQMPGQVGNAPRCTATAIGENRTKAFKVQGSTATVEFKVTGKKNCRVQLTANSFYAPSADGKPWSEQILYKRVTKNFTPGTYKMSIGLPPKSTPAKGCFYQVDLTYGIRNVLPVIAGKIDRIEGCGKPTPKPAAACKSLSVTKLSSTQFRFNASSTTTNGAKITSYVFKVYRGTSLIHQKKVTTSNKQASYTYSQATAGSYRVTVTVNTSVGAKTSSACAKPFTVSPPQEKNPGVDVNKLVDGVDYKLVGVNVEFTYQIEVTNTGEEDLKNVKVTDTPDVGVTLLSASEGQVAGNTWTHTIPELKRGESMDFTIQAKVPEFLAGRINNSVCVDAPEIPGTPDDCDEAEVEVSEPGKVKVCDPATGKVITVDEEDAEQYVPIGSAECEPEEEVITPRELPETGPAETILQLVGATSLTGAGAYYIASRRFLG